MGMFDNIRFKIKCPNCGKEVNDFQSKDGKCCMFELDYWEVDNFYASCDNCGTWIEYNLKEKRPKISIESYVRTMRTPLKKDDSLNSTRGER